MPVRASITRPKCVIDHNSTRSYWKLGQSGVLEGLDKNNDDNDGVRFVDNGAIDSPIEDEWKFL